MNTISICCDPLTSRRVAVSLLILLFALPASHSGADRLYLADGESITGALIGIEAGKVKWLSAMLGELEIEQHHVAMIETSEHYDLKTSGRDFTHCSMSVALDTQQLHCDQGVETLASWKLVVAAGESVTAPPPLSA